MPNPGNIEAAYPLSPLQEGILFHCLREGSRDLYLTQYTADLKGSLDPRRFRQAWERIVSRHGVLRTFFTWERRERPLQVVREQVELPFRVQDWRELTPEERQTRWQELLRQDRAAGFDLSQAPLLRIELIRQADDAWRLLWSVHHILLDGWSGRLTLRELAAVYASGGEGGSRSPAFSQYVAWLGRHDLTRAREFWAGHLAGFESPTPLPADRGEPAATASRGHADLELDEETTALLPQACRTARVTLNTLTVGAWALILGRHAAETEVAFGVTVAHRPPEIDGVEQAVGLYLNTIPVRVRLDRSSTVEAWLRDLQATLAAVREFDYTPLNEVLRTSKLGSALFESLVAFENFPPTATEAACDFRFENEVLLERSNYPLALLAFPGKRFRLTLVYDSGRFAAEQIDKLLVGLATAIEGLAKRPAAKLTEISVLPPAELRLVRDQWSRPPRAVDAAEDALARIADVARRQPNDIAVADASRQLSYAELLSRARRLGRRLRDRGAGPGGFVALILERSCDLMVAILATLETGAAYVPVAPDAPPVRFRRILDQLRDATGQEPIVLGRSGAIESDSRILDFEQEWQAAADLPDAELELADSGSAYVIFTSGSTGEPKGVVVGRRALALSTAARFVYYRKPVRAFLLLSSPAVDSSIAGIYWTLCSGGKLVLPPERIEQSVDDLLAMIERHRISHLLALPALYRAMLEHASPAALASLECVVVAGESCPRDLVSLHRRILPKAELHNEYGPAEGAVWATADELTAEQGPVTIGRPAPHSRVFVLDEDLALSPPGAPGEICLGGDALADGYLGRADLAAERFVANPLEPGGRLYRTGDRGRWSSDGRLEFLGRSDEQIKLRGYRIELTEIERALEEHPGVREAAAAVVGSMVERDADALVRALAALEPRQAEVLIDRFALAPRQEFA